jgi:hypothetical protein
MPRDLAYYQARQAERMREAAKSRKRGDCQRCGHVAGTPETDDQNSCDWSAQHKHCTTKGCPC